MDIIIRIEKENERIVNVVPVLVYNSESNNQSAIDTLLTILNTENTKENTYYDKIHSSLKFYRYDNIYNRINILFSITDGKDIRIEKISNKYISTFRHDVKFERSLSNTDVVYILSDIKGSIV